MSVRPAAHGFGRLSGWASEGAVLALALTTPILIYVSIGVVSGDPSASQTASGATAAAATAAGTQPQGASGTIFPVPQTAATPVDSAPPAAPAAQPTALPKADPTAAPAHPDPAATPFRLVPSPVQASASFANFTGTCTDDPPAFYDRFTFTTGQGTLTVRQASTSQVSTGPIQPDGTFHVSAADGRETYDGRIQGLNATAHFVEARDTCSGAYDVTFRFLV